MSFDLSEFTTDINVVEVFFCQKNPSAMVIDVRVDERFVRYIESKFKNPKTTAYKSYHIRDKIYTYEIGNDNQIVHSKFNVKHQHIVRIRKNLDLFIVSSKIEKFPPYLFPCTNEIDYVASYTIQEFKINNRISLNIRAEDGTYTAYIEYKHSQNVELDKMNETINRLIKSL
jgi:hypothetical protein